jgi:transposase
VRYTVKVAFDIMQHERGRLPLFLHEPDIEPTINRAEPGLRPVVIARKLSQRSKNERGATTYATLRTVFGTLRLRTVKVVDAFGSLFNGEALPAAKRESVTN